MFNIPLHILFPGRLKINNMLINQCWIPANVAAGYEYALGLFLRLILFILSTNLSKTNLYLVK